MEVFKRKRCIKGLDGTGSKEKDDERPSWKIKMKYEKRRKKKENISESIAKNWSASTIVTEQQK